MADSTNRLLQLLVGATIVLALCVVVLGAYTRLVDAGLGCPDWPGCYGHLTVPDTEEERMRAEELFPDFPVDEEKAWIEMVHRYFATLLGIVVIAIVAVAWFKRQSLRFPLVLLALVVLQGAFGAWTVTLKLWPQVVTAHLLGGFATLALLWWYLLKLDPFPLPQVASNLRAHIHVLLVLVVLQVALGGWTSSNYAALACPDFPLCHGELFPDMDFASGFNVMQDIGPNYLGGELSNEARIAIQTTHRWGAYVVMVVGIALLFRLELGFRVLLGTALVVQFGLGIANVLLSLPLFVAVCHNAVAALLLLALLTIMFGSRAPPPIPVAATEAEEVGE